MRKSWIALALFLALGNHQARAQCSPNQWCQTWPVAGVSNTGTSNSAWNTLVFSPGTGRFYVYADDQWGGNNDPWADAFLSYAALGAPATAQPWNIESQCGTSPANGGINPNHVTLLNSITATDQTMTVVTPPLPRTGYFRSTGTLVIGNEAIDYASVANDVIGSTVVTFGSLGRGARQSAGNGPPSAHQAGHLVRTACPGPLLHGAPSVDHPANRHPVDQTTYDSRRGRLWEAGGYEEVFSYNDTWYLCIAPSPDCTAAQIAAGWTRVLTSTGDSTAGNIPGYQESGMVYDPDNDVIVMYGGLITGNPSNQTWIFCFAVNPAMGCAAANQWNRVTTIGDAGPRNAVTMTYDTVNHRVLVFGSNSTNITIGMYDTAARTWKVSSPAPIVPPTRFRSPALTFDTRRKAAAFYNGPGSLYLYDVATDLWKLTGVPGGPVLAAGANLAYDNIHDVYVFESVPGLQTWELPGSAIDGAPPPDKLPPAKPMGLVLE